MSSGFVNSVVLVRLRGEKHFDRYFGEVRALACGFVQLTSRDRVQLLIAQFDRLGLVVRLLPDDLVFRLLLAHALASA